MVSNLANFVILCCVFQAGITKDVVYKYSQNTESPFYDIKTHTRIPMELVSSLKDLTKQNVLQYVGRSNGCNCQELTCGCCVGMNITQFNFNNEGCMNFTYDPDEFAIRMNMIFNQNSVWMDMVSAKNPPPICMPVPLPLPPPIPPPQLDFCIKMFDIFTPGRNLHMCMDMEMRLSRASVFVLHFDCMRMGQDGLAFLKPSEGGGLSTMPTVSTSQLASDIYDPITEIII